MFKVACLILIIETMENCLLPPLIEGLVPSYLIPAHLLDKYMYYVHMEKWEYF